MASIPLRGQGLGYIGRTAVGELLLVDETIEELVLARSRTHIIHEAGLRAGMVPLAADAAQRVRDGITTVEEIGRVLPTPGKSPL